MEANDKIRFLRNLRAVRNYTAEQIQDDLLQVHADQIGALMKQMADVQNEASLNAKALVHRSDSIDELQNRVDTLEGTILKLLNQ